MKTKIVLAIFFALIYIGCSKKENDPEPVIENVDGIVEINYTLNHIYKMASNQIAIWIEDYNGNYIRSIFATNFTADGGYVLRPESLPVWIAKSDWKNASKEEIDAVSGATQSAGNKYAIWDCKDSIGSPVKQGYYKYVIEGNVFWGSRVIYTGIIKLGSEKYQSTANAEYFSTTAEKADSLIKNVKATYTPKP